MSFDRRPADGAAPAGVAGALEAGVAVRAALRAYRSRFGEAARAASAGEVPSEVRRDAFETLRADWERTVEVFRETVDRVGTAQKTLARDR